MRGACRRPGGPAQLSEVIWGRRHSLAERAQGGEIDPASHQNVREHVVLRADLLQRLAAGRRAPPRAHRETAPAPRHDLELEESGGTIVVYRSRKNAAIGSTKSDRFRAVEIGPALGTVMRDQLARRSEPAAGERAAAGVFVMPVRTLKRTRGRWASAGGTRPLDHNTPGTETLTDAALRDMPAHVHFASEWIDRADISGGVSVDVDALRRDVK